MRLKQQMRVLGLMMGVFFALAVAVEGQGQPLMRLKATLTAHEKRLSGVAWSPDGKFIATTGEDKLLKLWDVTSNQEQYRVSTGITLTHLQWSPSGEFIAGWGDANKLAIVFNLAKRGPQCVLRGHSGDVKTAEWSSDNCTLMTLGEDRAVKMWDVLTCREKSAILPGGEQLRQTKSLAKAILTKAVIFDWDLTFAYLARDGKTLVTVGDEKQPTLWDTGTGKAIVTWPLYAETGMFYHTLVSPDRGRAAVYETSGIRLYDLASGQLQATFPWANERPVFSADGRLLLMSACLEKESYSCKRSNFIVYDLAAARIVTQWKSERALYWFELGAVSLDGRVAVTAVRHETAYIWDTTSGRLKGSLPLGKNRSLVADTPDKFYLSPNGQVLLNITERYAKFWATSNGQPLAQEEAKNKSRLLPAAFSPNGNFAFTNDGRSGKLNIWEIAGD